MTAGPHKLPGPPARPAVAASSPAARLVLVAFAVTLFVGAVLLFVVEPMVGKMVLPTLGGSPAVWNTCLLFFQAVLLAGYAYAHLSTVWLGVRRQVLLHLAILLLPLFTLPLVIARGQPPTSANPIPWLLWRLLVSIGLPFFVVSTTAPLMQRWFAATGHPAACDPYFLYAASNAGSLLALLGYPLLLEPALPLPAQSLAWAAAYAVLVVLILFCALLLRLSPRVVPETAARLAPGAADATAPDVASAAWLPWGNRLWWMFLSFVPSSLLLGVTTHITTDVAAVPLLWVVPLALYLLTFILVFARRPPLPHWLMTRLLPIVLLPVAVLTTLSFSSLRWLMIPLHLLAFFVAGMVCHGRLAASRPPPDRLTEYYLWLSIGGVLGGLFNAILAPLLFSAVVEYPLALALSGLALPMRKPRLGGLRAWAGDILSALALLAVAWALAGITADTGLREGATGHLLVFGLPAVICFAFSGRPPRFTLSFGACLLVWGYLGATQDYRTLCRERNFFGVKRVLLDPLGEYHILRNGGTVHGSQSRDPDRGREPLTYYHRTGPIGDIFDELATRPDADRVAVVGLGTGTLACYARPGQHFTFYEIDPGVAEIATNEHYFTFLAQCAGTYDIVLGDGRLTLAAAPDHAYALIVLDAFSSDAVPIHLLTREALELYLTKLKDDGLLVYHTSNRYLDLKPVLGRLAHEAGLVCRYREDHDEDNAPGKYASEYVVIVRDLLDLGLLAWTPEWRPLEPQPGTPAWTDQHSNILSLIQWR